MLIKAVPLINIFFLQSIRENLRFYIAGTCVPLICTIRELVGSQIPVFFYLRKYLTNNKFSECPLTCTF